MPCRARLSASTAKCKMLRALRCGTGRRVPSSVQSLKCRISGKHNYSCLAVHHQATQHNDKRMSTSGSGSGSRMRLMAPPPACRWSSTAGIAEPSALVGFWQSVSNSAPVAYMQHGLTAIHDFTGLPWWATIVLSTVLFRSAITLPLTIYQQKITARIELISLEMPAIVSELKREASIAMKKFQWTEQHTRLVYNRSLKQQWNKLIVRDNCHPAKTLIVLWGQIPLWICQSVALRNFVHMLPDPNSLDAKLIFTELTIGGFGWIPNLTEVDSSYILPVALGIINLGIIEMQTILRTRPPTRLQRYATNAFRALSVVMIPVACTVPAALCVYWVTSSSYGLAQNVLLMSPTVRRTIGIPLTKSEVQNPYEQVWNTIKIRTGQMEPIAKDMHEDNSNSNNNSNNSTSSSSCPNNSSSNKNNKS